MDETAGVPGQARRIEQLLARLQASRDPSLVAAARELVEALMDLHGGALARMLEIAEQSGAAGRDIITGFGRDDLVGSLLVLYGLHPEDIETRVRREIGRLESRLAKHDYSVQLLGVEDGVVRLVARATAQNGRTSPGSIKTVIQEAIYGAAPDAVDLIIEGLEERPAAGFVPIEMLTGSNAQPILVGAKGGA